jgi:transposase
MDLRERVYDGIETEVSARAAARRFGVSAATGVRWAQRMVKTGSLRQGRSPGHGKLAPWRDRLIVWVKRDTDITMPELAAKLMAAGGPSVHPTSLSRLLCAAGLSFKKGAESGGGHPLGGGYETPRLA